MLLVLLSRLCYCFPDYISHSVCMISEPHFVRGKVNMDNTAELFKNNTKISGNWDATNTRQGNERHKMRCVTVGLWWNWLKIFAQTKRILSMENYMNRAHASQWHSILFLDVARTFLSWSSNTDDTSTEFGALYTCVLFCNGRE